MSNFFRGLVSGFLGLIAWILTSVLAAADKLPDGEVSTFLWVLVGVSFGVMVLGPAFYWLLGPIWSITHRKGRKQPSQT